MPVSAGPPVGGRSMRIAGAERWLIVALSLAALALRLYRLDSQPLWSDEGLSIHRAGLGLVDVLRGRIVVDGFATTDPMPPLYFLVVAAGRVLLGDGVWAQRFIGAALAVAAVPLAWVAGRRLFGRAAGVAAAALIAGAPFVVWYSQELRPYALVVPCVFGLTAIAAGAGRPTRRAWRWAGMAVIGVLVHPFVAFVAAAQVPFVVPAAWRAASNRTRQAAGVAAGAAALLAVPRLVAILGGPTQVDFGPVEASTVTRHALAAFAVGISPSLDHPLPRTAPLALLAVVGGAVGCLDRRTRRAAALVIAGLGLPILGVIGLSAVNPLYNGPRHVLPALPAFVLVVAASARLPAFIGRSATIPRTLSSAGGRRRATMRNAAGAAVGVALAGVAAWAAVVLMAHLRRQFVSSNYVKDDLRSLVADVAVRIVPGDRIVLHDALIGFTFDAEAAELGVALPWEPVPRFPNEDRHVAEARLLAIRPAEGGRIWFVDRPTPRGGFEGEYLVQAADKHWDLVERRQYTRLWLRVGLREYRLDEGPAQRAAATGIRPLAAWSNGLTLIGAASERPRTAAGQRLGIVAVWQTDAPPVGEITFEVRLRRRSDGRTINLGSDMLLRDRDGDEFAPDQVIETALRAVVPLDAPPGSYDVQLRVSDAVGGRPTVTAGPNEHPSAPDDPWVHVLAVDVDPPLWPSVAVRRLARHLEQRLEQRPE